MARKQLIFTVVFVTAGALLGWLGKGLASPGAPLPGSQEDPLVTRAYVDTKFKLTVVELASGETLVDHLGLRLS